MKVVQINAGYWFSSIGRTTMELHEAMLQYNIEAYCACANFHKIVDKEHFYQIGGILGRKVHALFSRMSGKQAYYSRHATRKLLKWLDKISPDILHLRNLHSNYISFPLLMKYANEKKIPIVITLHDLWFLTGGCCYYTEYNCLAWQDSCGNCPAIGTGVKSWWFDRTEQVLKDRKKYFEECASRLAVIGVSDWATEQVKKSVLRNASILKRIYNWIDTDKFYPRNPKEISAIKEQLNITGKKVILGVAQHWTKEKGINAILDVAKILTSEYVVVLVGECYGYDLSDNVFLAGEVNDIEKLALFYSAADVFLHLSERETFGKVAVEALACGTPCILNETTGLKELVDDTCGALVERDEAQTIKKRIEDICAIDREVICANCVKRVEENFSKKILIGEYINVYKQLYQSEQ